MFTTTQPPNARTEADTGLPDHFFSALSAIVAYLQRRLELAGIEGREAVVSYGAALGLLAAAIGLLLFGYVFLWIGIIAVIAHAAQLSWGWITLAVGLLHLIGTAGCLWAASLKWGQPVFIVSMREFRKDQEWLSSPKQTANRN